MTHFPSERRSRRAVNFYIPGALRPGAFGLLALLLTTPALAFGAKDVDLKVKEDGQVQGQVVATEAASVFKLKSAPRHGEAVLDAVTGAFTYTPDRDFSGDDTFAVEVTKGKRKAKAAVRIDVEGENDAPVAAALSLKTAEDTAVRGNVKVTDADKDTVAFMVGREPQHGQAMVDARTGAVSYQPAADYFGADGFSIEVTDGRLTAMAEVSVLVTPVNDGPVAANAALSVKEDAKLSGKASVTDVDGDALTYRISKLPKHGDLVADAATGAFTYVPAKDFHGEDAFVLEVTDGKKKASAAMAVKVEAVNDAPVTRALSMSTLEDVAVSGLVLASDVDGDTLGYEIGKAAAHGTASVDKRSGKVSYLPAADYNGADIFTVVVGDAAATAVSEVSVAVAAVNDAPRVAAGSFSFDEDSKLIGKATAMDVDGDALTYRLVRKPAHGAFELDAATGAFVFMPVKNYFGADAFALEVSDGKLKTEVPIALDVKAVNDAPTAKALVLATAEDTAVKGAVLASDVDDAALQYAVKVPAKHGEASVEPRTGAVSYVPSADYNGPDAFVVEVRDGALAATSTVSVAVAAVPDIPRVRAAVLETLEDTAETGMLPGMDPDGDRLTFRLLSQPRLGAAVLVDAATGAWKLTPGADLNGEDELRFDVSDGTTTVQGAVKILVAAVNDAPTLVGLSLSTLEDVGVEGQLLGKDIDGDVLTYTVVGKAAKGTAKVVDATKGVVRFEPARDQNGSTEFMVTVSDGKLKSAPVKVLVAIAAQNDAPLAGAMRVSTAEDIALMGALQAGDVDGDPMTFTVVSQPRHGTVTVTDARAGLYVYQPAPDYYGEDEFEFAVSDASKASSQAPVRINVTPVDDTPVAAADGITAPFRGTVTGRLHGFDRESKQVTYRIVEQPQFGRVRLLNERTGDFEFATDGSTNSRTEFRFEVSDGSLTSEPAAMAVAIHSL